MTAVPSAAVTVTCVFGMMSLSLAMRYTGAAPLP